MKIKFLILVLIFSFPFTGTSQKVEDSIKKVINNDIRLSALPYYNFGKGLGLTSADSLFQFNIRFRIQNRATLQFNEDEESKISAQIRRLRLRFDGYVGDPRFTYVIQLSFSPGDVGTLQQGQNINVIRDAIVFYRPNRHWNIGFGQTKLPGNRQRVNSSGALQFTDRTINNARFTIDRDFGIQVYYLNSYPDKFGYEIKTAVSTGEGRNWTQTSDNNLAYTGKLELYPFGNFTNGGAYFEGDVMRETTPKLMLSGVYHFNHGAVRTGGQLGALLYEPRDLTSLLFDALLKYNGWAFQTAYLIRDTDNPITINPDNTLEQAFVIAGSGYDAQLSYNFPNNLEFMGRFSISTPQKEIIALLPESKQFSIGATKYIWEHAFKIQAELTHEQLTINNGPVKNNWYFRFQVELGI